MSKISYVAAGLAALLVLGGGTAMAQRNLAPPAGTPMATAHLNPNTATEAQLRAAPNVSPELAAAIVKGRPYATPTALGKVVAGKIPAAQLPAFYAAVFVPINLNTGKVEDMLLIPGMSQRMTHEFEDYRPYKDMEQFRREIGKYVDATEVARLASYVTLR